MAVNHVYQREIVEVPFVLPDGKVLPHPALVISCDDLQVMEPGLFLCGACFLKEHHPRIDHPNPIRMAVVTIA